MPAHVIFTVSALVSEGWSVYSRIPHAIVMCRKQETIVIRY